MAYITVDKENSTDIDLYYEDHGAGRPVILIHGWPLSGASWEKQLPVLLKAGHRVITYDRRGFGKSSKPISGYNYDVLADDLHKLITKLDLHDITLVGFSMGGGEVARYLGFHGTERVSAAVFISSITPYLLGTGDNREGVEASVFDDIRHAIEADRPAFLAKFLKDFYKGEMLAGKKISEEAFNLSWYVAAEASPIATLDCVSAWLVDFRADLKKIDIPTLVIHGNADRIIPFESSGKRMTEFVRQARLVTIEGGPHGLNWTHAEELNRHLLDFLAREIPKKAAA